MSDISLLPEGLRGQEGAVQKQKTAPPQEAAGLKMHVPDSGADEDIEIIEVDESDLGAILADEPLFTRVSYQLSVALDTLKTKLFQQEQTPPPKLPPQFFTPPKPGLVTKPGTPAAGAAGTATAGATGAAGGTVRTGTTRARITPQSDVPRRVRVIRRVRKPVRISLLSAEELLAYQVDVPRRKWTLGVCAILFTLILTGGYILLSIRTASARTALASLNDDLTRTRSSIQLREQEWSVYRDLQRRLTVLDDLLNNHVVITRSLDFLEHFTLPDVYYKSATVSPSGLISLDTVATSYEAAARQLVAFKKSPLVRRVESLSFSKSLVAGEEDAATTATPGPERAAATEVGFNIILEIDPLILRGPQTVDFSSGALTSTTTPRLPAS